MFRIFEHIISFDYKTNENIFEQKSKKTSFKYQKYIKLLFEVISLLVTK